MKVQYRKKFLADLARIPSIDRRPIEKFAFEEVPALGSIAESGKIERLKGYKSCYEVRFGAFRVGLKFENDVVSFERVLHRLEIYRFFP